MRVKLKKWHKMYDPTYNLFLTFTNEPSVDHRNNSSTI